MGKTRSKASRGRSNTKSKGNSKGKGKGSSKGGGKSGKKDGVIKKGKLKEKADGKGGGKGGGGGKGDEGGGKGKGKGKGKGSGPVGSRKERKQAAVARSKGLPPPGQKAPEKTVAPVGQKSTIKGNRRMRPGQAKRKAGDGDTKKKKWEEEAEKPKKKRIRIRRNKRKGGADEEDATPASVQPKCKNGHAMGQRSDNPPAYKNEACCDACGKEKLAKKLSHFFHCSFCRFDLCPQCAATFKPDMIRKKAKKEMEELLKNKDKKQKGPKESNPGIPGAKERREIWIPSEAEAVSRAPVSAKNVVSDWVEGMPV